jgi:hypothetical protein
MREGIPMKDEPDAYHAYMLRLWRTRCHGRWEWRASVESPHTGERQAFASLEQLFAFLSERCDSQTPGTPRKGRRAVG